MKKELNTMLDVLSAIDLVSRAGGSPTTKKVGQIAGSSFYRTRRLLSSARASGLIDCYERRHRINSTARIWVLTVPGLKVVRAFQDGIRSQAQAPAPITKHRGYIRVDHKD